MKSFSKGIDPELAVQELERIEIEFGSLTAETILRASEDDNALLHPLFEWDDSEAAIKYRLQQARQIINNVEVVVLADGEERTVPMFEIIRTKEESAYKNVSIMSFDDAEQVRTRTVRELNYLRNKLSLYKKFSKAVTHINYALGALDIE